MPTVDIAKEVDELMTRDQAAAFLGVKTQTLACWATTKRHNLPYVKVGRLVRYRRSDIEQWMQERTVTGTADLD